MKPVSMSWRERAFDGQFHRAIYVPEGRMPAISEMLDKAECLPRAFREVGEARINDILVPREMWGRVRPKPRMDLEIAITLHIPLRDPGTSSRSNSSSGAAGGKSSIALVATIAVLLAAAAVSGGALGAAGFGLFPALAGGTWAASVWHLWRAQSCGAQREEGCMTAINIFVQSDRVSFVTDGCAFDSEGKLVLWSSKAIALSHLKVIVACRGSALALPIVASVFGSARSYDDLKDRAAKLSSEAMDLARAVWTRNQFANDIEVYVGGFTDAGVPDAYCVDASDGTVSPIEDLAITPTHDRIDAEIEKKGVLTGRSIGDLDPRADGLTLLKIQRRHLTFSPGSTRGVYGVGCFAQITSVYPDGRCVSETIHRWPEDKIGQTIDPGDVAAEWWKGEAG